MLRRNATTKRRPTWRGSARSTGSTSTFAPERHSWLTKIGSGDMIDVANRRRTMTRQIRYFALGLLALFAASTAAWAQGPHPGSSVATKLADTRGRDLAQAKAESV